MSVHARSDAGRVATLAGLVALAVAVVALVVRLVAAGAVRGLLAFPFPADPLGLLGAWQVLLDNLRLAMAPLLAARLLFGSAGRPTGFRARVRPLARALFDTALVAAVAVNVLVIGASYGAYGWLMVRYTLPHGPVELAGFACVLAVYLDARKQTLTRRRAVSLSVAGFALLALAAVLEGLLAPV